jgi:hypothetical protein
MAADRRLTDGTEARHLLVLLPEHKMPLSQEGFTAR